MNLIYKIINLQFYINEEKLNELNDSLTSFVSNHFSGIIGGVFLLFLLIIITFSLISGSSRKQ